MITQLEQFFNTWIELFPYPIILANDLTEIVLANESARNHFNLTTEKKEFLNKHLYDVENEKKFSTFALAVKSTPYLQCDIKFSDFGDSTVIGRFFYTPEIDYSFFLIFPHDFHERYAALKEKYDALMYHVSDSVLITDKNQKIIEVNTAFSAISGYKFEEVVGRFPTILSSGRHTDGFYKDMFLQIHSQGFFKSEIVDRKKNGELIHADVTIIGLKDTQEKINGFMGILNDITELKKLKSSLKTTKFKDPLTNVQNRESFLQVLDIKCDSATPENPIALLFIDLNKFKQVNDTYGHRYGDYVLSKAANRMQNILRSSDLIGRYGGDEFLILLERVNETTVHEIANKLQEALAVPYVIDEQVINFISGSIGISFAPQDAIQPQELIEHADASMYQAKKVSPVIK